MICSNLRAFFPKAGSSTLFTLLFLFLLCFPKGGIKIGNLPITWGYLLLIFVAIFLGGKKNRTQSNRRAKAFLLTVPFQLFAATTLVWNGFVHWNALLAFLFSFYFLPIFFFILGSEYMEKIDVEKFYKMLQLGILFVTSYGIFLFVFHTISNRFIEIPFLTVNFQDLGELKNKCNDRGILCKLVSTYNNGNIYGVCILLLLPLYCTIEPSRWKQSLVKTSLILTLSRTVWVGMLFHEFLTLFILDRFVKPKIVQTLWNIGWMLTSFVFLGWVLKGGSQFLLDPSLGGRIQMFSLLSTCAFCSHQPFAMFGEIVYLSVLFHFGIIGLFLFLLNMLSPLIIAIKHRMRLQNDKIKLSIVCGLINYLFVSLSDGAILFIPTMTFYWFLSSLLLKETHEPVKIVNGSAT